MRAWAAGAPGRPPAVAPAWDGAGFWLCSWRSGQLHIMGSRGPSRNQFEAAYAVYGQMALVFG